MALAIPNTFSAAETITASEVNENFQAVADTINGQLTQANLASDAAIPNSKLATSTYEFVLHMTVDSTAYAAASAGDFVAACGIPASTTHTYTVDQIDYFYINSTASAGDDTFTIKQGYYNGGVWTGSSTVTNALTIAASTSATGKFTVLDNSPTISTTNQYFYVLEATSITGTRPFGTADNFITVAIKLTASLK